MIQQRTRTSRAADLGFRPEGSEFEVILGLFQPPERVGQVENVAQPVEKRHVRVPDEDDAHL